MVASPAITRLVLGGMLKLLKRQSNKAAASTQHVNHRGSLCRSNTVNIKHMAVLQPEAILASSAIHGPIHKLPSLWC